MSDNQNWNNVGDQIKDALQDALDTGDFKQLNTVVSGTVSSALSEAKRQMKMAADNISTEYYGQSSPNGEASKGAGSQNAGPGMAGNWNAGQKTAQTGGAWNAGQGASQTGGAWNAGQKTAQTGGAWNAGQKTAQTGGAWNAGQKTAQTGGAWNAGQGAAQTGGAWNASRNGNRAGAGRNGAWNQGSYNFGAWNYGSKKDTFHYKKRNMSGGVYTSQTQKPSAGSAYREKAYNLYRNSMANQTNRSNLPAVKTRKVGSVSGTLYLVFGGIGTGVMACALIVVILMFFFAAIQSVWPLFIVGAFLIAFLVMIERGCVKKERLKRAKRYVDLCDGKTYINIDDLAMHLSKSRRFVLRDVRKMLKLGIFPEGHLDEKDSCLMLDDATYREYIRLEKERKVREMEDKMAKMRNNQKQGANVYQEEQRASEVQAVSEEPAVNTELEALIADGQECIRKLRDMNDAIDGEVISSKLFQLENLLKEIFDRVREHPDQMPQMHKFMDYYLPTTLKLVQAYSEFDSMSVPGEDIISAKEEIEKTLDTINRAFTELLNNLFRDSVFDVTTDAQVLQTMLAKEGLTREMELEKVPR